MNIQRERFTILRPLGSGGSAQVFLVEDHQRGGPTVALKVSHSQPYASEAAHREFSQLARLDHPNVVQVHDLDRLPDGRLALVVEYVQGEDLRCWSDRSREDDELLIPVLVQVCRAMSYLHNRGIVHGDIKPQNIIVSESTGGDAALVKLVDFGLASQVNGPPREGISGTLEFMAPEIKDGGPPSVASDLYSLGASLSSVLSPHSPLRDLALWLTADQPDQRPDSVALVIENLGQRTGVDRSLSREELLGPYFPTPPHVGREPELASLESASCGVTLLRGPEGIGKTSLLHELRTRALLAGRRCVLAGATTSGGPMQNMAAALGVDCAERGPEEGALERVVDAMVARITDLAEGQDPGLELLLVDDVTGEDRLCRRFLSRMASNPAVICCAAVDDSRWTAAQDELAARCDVLALSGLTAADLRSLLGGMLPEHDHRSAVVDEVLVATGGNPHLVVELIREAIESGQISPADERYDLDVELADLSSLARSRVAHLDLEVRARLTRLAYFIQGAPPTLVSVSDELARRGLVLESREEAMVRVASRWLREELLSGLTEEQRIAGHLAAAKELEPLANDSLPLARERAEQLALGGNNSEAASLFATVASEQAAAFDLASAAAGHQRCVDLCAPGTELQLQALSDMARVLRLSGDYEQAMEAHFKLIDLCGDRDEDRRLEAELDMAETLAARGNHPETQVVLQGLADQKNDNRDFQARIFCLWGRCLVMQGDYPAAEEKVRVALSADLPGGDRDEIGATLEHLLGLCRLMQGDDGGAMKRFSRALTIFGELDDLHGSARTINSQGIVRHRRGELASAAEAYEHCLNIARQVGDLQLETIYTLNLGTVAQQQYRLGEALKHYRVSLASAHRLCNERDIARISTNLGNLMMQLGQLDEASRLLEDALERSRRLGLKDLEAHALLFWAEVAAASHDWEQVHARAKASAAGFAEQGLAEGEAEAWLIRAHACLQTRDYSGALRGVRRAEGGYTTDSLAAVARFVEGSVHGTRPDAVDPARGRRCLKESLAAAERGGVRALPWRVYLALAGVSEDAVDRDYHLAKSEAALEDLLRRIPDRYREVFERVHVAPVRPPGHGASPPAIRAAGRGQDEGGLHELLRVNRELTRERRPERVLELIIDRAIDLTGAERGFVIIANQGKLSVEVARNIDQETLRRKSFKFSRSVAEQVVASAEPINTGDAMADNRFADNLSVHEMHLRSVLCVPLRMQARVLGALYLDNRFQQGAFLASHLTLLQAFADQAAIALFNARMVREAEQRNAELAETKAQVDTLNKQLQVTVTDQVQRIEAMTATLGSEQEILVRRYQASNLVGRGKAMCEIFRLIDRVANADVPVLIQGETGTGKEVAAKAIHYNSSRRGGPFISINCAAIPATLLESELFGHARGAFTGAVRDKPGLFEAAIGGTLMLDEVGDMPAEMQAKLLRVLQEGAFRRVGEERERTTDARIISASHHDLSGLVRARRFREDLYYRLNVVLVRVPPLRDRPEDIPELVQHFLEQQEVDGPRPTMGREALALLLRYNWPGNVRELNNEVRRATVLGDGHVVPRDLSARIRRPGPEQQDANTLAAALAATEREAIIRALKATNGSVTEAAKLLGISRVVLHRKLRKHAVDRRRLRATG